MRPTSDPTLRFLLVWQLGTLILVLLLPAAVLGSWPWELPRSEFMPFVGLLAAFVSTALLHLLIRHRSGWSRLISAMVGSAAIFSFLLLALFVTRVSSSRVLLLAVFGASLAILPLPFLRPKLRMTGVAILAAVLIGAMAVKKHQTRAAASVQQRIQSYLSTNLYNLSVIANVGYVRRPAARGGGLAGFGAHTLLATGDGYLYLLDSSRNSLSVRPLAYRVPLNGERFAADVGGEYKEPSRSSGFGLHAAAGVQTWRFRVADVLVQDLGDRLRLFASHHYWRHVQRCYVIRVSMLEVGRDGALAPHATAQWRTLFESTPCLPLEGKDAKRGKNPFQGEDVGGRMVLLDERTLLLGTGDLGFCGLESWQMFPQDPNASYGKTLRIHIDSGASEVFTLGHRNPQGLLKESTGDLLLTEHGPRGGDELNLLRAGANYGWPRVTYGTDYFSFVWPLNPHQGGHEGFEEPIYAWAPSIGVSNLIRLSHDLLPGWRNDLLIGSLATRSLYRVRTRDRRVILVEPIPIAHRVRDLIELPDGRILVWTDEAALVEIAPTEEMNGALLYGSLCQSCHWMHDGLSHRAGPDLSGVLGRKVAGAAGFAYSPALRQLGGQWTEDRLDRFLRDPQAMAPGTSMAFEGIADKRQRAMLISHLRERE